MPTRRSGSGGSKRAQRKASVRAILAKRDWPALLEWARNERDPPGTLTSLMFDLDEQVRWRAVEATGRVAALMAESDLDSVRELIRRLLWSMNDESGNLVWNAPEAIGEVLVNVPVLIDEYAGLLPSFLREEPFERGTHWAIARVGRLRPDLFADAVGELVASLESADAYQRAFAVLALDAIGAQKELDQAGHLLRDEAPVSVYDYDTGRMVPTTVAGIARQQAARRTH